MVCFFSKQNKVQDGKKQEMENYPLKRVNLFGTAKKISK